MLSAYNNGFVINTNMASLIVQNNLAKATNDMTFYMERLATGLRIERAMTRRGWLYRLLCRLR
jgi:homogentisate 1,2-dioxygenase